MRSLVLVGVLLAGVVSAAEGRQEVDLEPIERILARLPVAGEEVRLLRDALATLSGRAALGEQVETVHRQARTGRWIEALDEIQAGPLAPPAAREWLERQGERYERDLREVEKGVAELSAALRDPGAVGARLARFLDRPDAARLLYSALIRPRLRPDRMSFRVSRTLVRGDDGKLLTPAILRDQVKLLLAQAGLAEGQERFSATEAWFLTLVARSTAQRLDLDDELGPAWNALLNSEHCLAVAEDEPPAINDTPWDLLQRRTPFGRALVRTEEGRVFVNPHALYDLGALLDRLEQTAADEAPLRRALEEGTGVGSILVQAARLQVEATGGSVRGADDWIAAVFDTSGDVPRLSDTGRRRLTDLADRFRRTSVEMEQSPVRVSVALDQLEYDDDSLELLRSSAFYNPRTGYGHWIYTTEFEDHHSARLFGLFSWNAQQSRDLDDFLQRIRTRIPQYAELAKSHDKLIILIENVPAWLSSSDDRGSFENGSRPNACAHPPRDPEVWKTMVRTTAELFSQLQGAERYYEFWNEPDLDYWQSGIDEFIDLYALTAEAVKEGDPHGKIGGGAPNQWDGRLRQAPDRDPVNLELIRAAARRDLPLDFVSWHYFGRPLEALAEAKQAYQTELWLHDFDPLPELLITEWAYPYRGTPWAAVGFAEVMLALFATKVDAQTVSAWEEFHARPDPKHFPPWGLVTQQGVRKNGFHAHRFFDRVARGSLGVATVRGGEKEPVVVVSREEDGEFDLLIWWTGGAPRSAAAMESLTQDGIAQADLRHYQIVPLLERALVAGEARKPEHGLAFERAGALFRDHPVQTCRLVLELTGVERIELLAAESVRLEHEPRKEIAVLGNRLTCGLRPYELLRLRLRVD